MATNAQQISLAIKKEIQSKIPIPQIKKGVESAAQKAIEIIRNRTMRGIDVNGKRLPGKKFHYVLKSKQTGKITLVPSYFMKKSTGAGLAELKKDKVTTEFEALGSPSHGRLTGQLFSGMRYQITQNADFKDKISGSFRIYVESSQAKKLEWLASDTGATKLNTKRGRGVKGKGQTMGFFSDKNSPKRSYQKAKREIWGLSINLAARNKEIREIEGAFLKELKYISRSADVKIS